MVSVCLNQWKFVQGHISWLEWSWNTITVLLSTNQILSRLTKRVELWMVSVTLGNQKGTNENEQKSFKYKALFWKEGLICFHCPVAGLNTTALNGGHLCETFRNSRSYMWIWGRKTIIMRKFHDKAVPLKETAPRLRLHKDTWSVTILFSSYLSFLLSDPTETCSSSSTPSQGRWLLLAWFGGKERMRLNKERQTEMIFTSLSLWWGISSEAVSWSFVPSSFSRNTDLLSLW